MASKRKTLCVDQKVSLIRAIEKGEKKSDVGKRFGFSPSTVATIWKNKDKILQAETERSSCKRIRKPKFEDLDQAMLTWFHKQCSNNVPISGPVLKTKAEHFAQQFGIIDFKASEGWLGKFKQRHNITYGKISREALNVDLNVANSWLINVCPKLNEKYTPEDIFNAGETGIYYRLTPDKTLKFKGEKCVGSNLSKERITVFVAANMSGTEKRKIMVIGKSKNPRCFKNIKRLPVTYKANKSAWMTSILFEEEIRKWDAELKGRKILLIVDNCPAHPNLSNLMNIEMTFFPANTTSIMQPMDLSFIKSLKGHYRKKILMEIIESDGNASINMLDTVNFLSKAWEEVTAETIRHSFRHVGLLSNLNNTEEKEKEQFEKDDISLSEWIIQSNTPHTFTPEDLQNYVEIDENLVTTILLTDEEILNAATKGEEEQKEYEEEEQPDEVVIPSIQQALDAAKLLEKYLLFHEDDPKLSQNMEQIHRKIQKKYWQNKQVQIKKTDYFK
uniref:Tigger transposable element-derived protein 4 n=1 Tax=Schizaphis graminum TaxID=13262 RepID=A0A2S2NVD0_SCHGA